MYPNPTVNFAGDEIYRRLLRMESAFDSALIGLCILDLDFRYVSVNKAFVRMYGVSEEHFIGRTVVEALPGPAPQIIAHLRDALDKGRIVEREIILDNNLPDRFPDSPDQLVYLRSAQIIWDERGEAYGISVSLTDITARKRAEAALHESEENLHHTLELSPHVPWTTDPSGEITFISPRWHVLTGSEPKVVHLNVGLCLTTTLLFIGHTERIRSSPILSFTAYASVCSVPRDRSVVWMDMSLPWLCEIRVARAP